MKRTFVVLLCVSAFSASLRGNSASLHGWQSAERVDAAAFAKIRDEGLNRSQVMEHDVLADRPLRSAADRIARSSKKPATGR